MSLRSATKWHMLMTCWFIFFYNFSRVMAFFALTLLVCQPAWNRKVCQEFECERTQMYLLLTNFSFHATQKTKRQRKGFVPKFHKTLLSIVFCWSLAPLRQGRRGLGLASPQRFFHSFLTPKKNSKSKKNTNCRSCILCTRTKEFLEYKRWNYINSFFKIYFGGTYGIRIR